MRPSSHPDVISYVRAHAGASHIILIDPDDASPDVAAQRCVAAVSAGSKMIFVGGSSGTAVVAAIEAARDLNPNQNCLVILPDSIRNYLTKFVDDDWMDKNNFQKE